ncbi:hypothetical protein PTTG_31092, partial [Puccinia triticina 1-1 BBBD Race 1]
LKYILEPTGAGLNGAAAEAVGKKHAETIDFLFQFISEGVFKTVVNTDNAEDPHRVWMSILNRFASASVNNKGRVWLKFMRYEYRGTLKDFISDMQKMLNEISLVSLGVPDNVLSFSILAKLNEDMYNIVDNIIMNEVICKNPNAVLVKLQEVVYLEES